MFQMSAFMACVNQDNTHFKRFALKSDLDPIIKLLTPYNVITILTPDLQLKVQKVVSAIPADKRSKYTKTLQYLENTLKVVNSAIPVKPLMKFEGFFIKEGSCTGYNKLGASKLMVLAPSMPGSLGAQSFVHRHTISWSSSDGSLGSLSKIRTREHVKFRADTQAAPFNKCADPDREFYAPGQAGTTGATQNIDDHSTRLPALICAYPRVAGTLVGEQWYQYSFDNGNSWQNMEGAAYLLEKSVRKVGEKWIFSFKKTNWAPHNLLPYRFEVDYEIGEPMEYMPRSETDFDQGVVSPADIGQYALRVIKS